MSEQATIVLEVGGDFELPANTEMLVARRLDRDVEGRELAAFLPRSFSFDDEAHWKVSDFKIGNYSQFRRAEEVPATLLSTALMMRCDVIGVTQEFSMSVIADRPGLRFRCRLTGTPVWLMGTP